jgi:transmembrane 9 superfamily protein 3
MFCSVGIVGEMEDDEGTASYYIWTHKKFDIGFNGKQIVDVNLTSENKVKLKLDAKIPFTYEVNWKKSNVKFEDRFDKYLDPNFFQHRVSAFLVLCMFCLFVFCK